MNWRDLVFHNLRWKLFSVFIAVVVWNTYHLSDGTLGLREEIFDTSATGKFVGVNVRVLTPQGSPYNYRASPPTVDFKVVGTREVVDSLSRGDLLVYVDAADFNEEGTNTVPVHVHIPTRATLLEVKPERIRLIRSELEPPVEEQVSQP
ncbi:MAG TPA: hypothetical protein DCY13_19470 [Verrucomicrobiales bacterium]|nr:hypothetical protein [Verrucomicrobiales bacterium]